MLTSSRKDRRLHVLEGIQHQFIPAQTTSINGNEYRKLVEFCILPGSPDLPHSSLCNPDGGWRSGDLFEKVAPGKYIFRGRDDDWIKTYWADKIDAKWVQILNFSPLRPFIELTPSSTTGRSKTTYMRPVPTSWADALL
jgi:hypothetical protein